jgi:hypothetical protein
MIEIRNGRKILAATKMTSVTAIATIATKVIENSGPMNPALFLAAPVATISQGSLFSRVNNLIDLGQYAIDRYRPVSISFLFGKLQHLLEAVAAFLYLQVIHINFAQKTP